MRVIGYAPRWRRMSASTFRHRSVAAARLMHSTAREDAEGEADAVAVAIVRCVPCFLLLFSV
jgi:hypothetical protein